MNKSHALYKKVFLNIGKVINWPKESKVIKNVVKLLIFNKGAAVV